MLLLSILIGCFFTVNGAYHSCREPSLVHSEHEWSSDFSPANVLRSVSCIQTTKRSAANIGNKYYVTAPGVKNYSFIIDIGCMQVLYQVTLRNAGHNYGIDHIGGGTEEFILEVSRDLKVWKKVVQGTLEDVRDMGCFAPYRKFNFNQCELTRFIKFTGLSHHGMEGNLEYLGWKAIDGFERTDANCENPIYESPNSLNNHFTAANLASDVCENKTGHAIGTAYIAKVGEFTNVIIDTGCEQEITAVRIRNTHNGLKNDRGTKQFRIDISTDKKHWTFVIRSTLTNALTKECLVPLEIFSIPPIKGRYIRILGESCYHRMGCGLQHVSWVTKD